MTPERAIEVLSKEKKMLRDDMEGAEQGTEWREHLQELVDAIELAETALMPKKTVPEKCVDFFTSRFMQVQ